MMRSSSLCQCLLSLAVIGTCSSAVTACHPTRSETDTADVIIYGGTSAGIAAAIQVARMGRTAILIEPGRHLGGLTSGGLGFTDSGDKRVIGGISREFYQRIRQHYDNPSAWIHEQAKEFDRYKAGEDSMWTFEPRVAEATFLAMLGETTVTIVMLERLNRESGVTMLNGRVKSLRMESGRRFTGHQYIDATYEGDLMAAAGVRYTVGRESNAVYGETFNGNQILANTHNHRFLKDVDPYVIPGNPASGLLPGFDTTGAGKEGIGDERVQAYCFRMCMSNAPDNRLPFPKPDQYDELHYELLLRNFEAGDLRFPMKPDMMPNRKTDTNNNCAVSTDYLGANYRYPDASYAERDAIVLDHVHYQQGLMWTLANHPRVPQSIRSEMAQWGLPADEFVDNGHWPHQLYIREARRMVSDYVATELDCRRIRMAEDSVGLGSYNMDSHNVRRFVTEAGYAQNEGDVQVSPGGPYLISYRSIIPAKGEARNLSVPVCLSSSHIAYGSIRMEPVFMVLGQSAATAAVQAIENSVDLQLLPFAPLRDRLLADGQVLDLPADRQTKHILSRSNLPGVVAEEAEARLTGVWTHSSSAGGFVGVDYIHDGNTEKGEKSIVWTLKAPSAGTFDLRFSYSANPNRATNVPIVVTTASGITELTVDQRQAPDVDQVFHSLGRYTLQADEVITLEIGTENTNGHVIADAVQLLRHEIRRP